MNELLKTILAKLKEIADWFAAEPERIVVARNVRIENGQTWYSEPIRLPGRGIVLWTFANHDRTDYGSGELDAYIECYNAATQSWQGVGTTHGWSIPLLDDSPFWISAGAPYTGIAITATAELPQVFRLRIVAASCDMNFSVGATAIHQP